MNNVNNNPVERGLVRSLPRPLGEGGRGRRGHEASDGVYRRTSRAKEPFTVKVSRKVNNARERLTWRFGLYGARHVFPLGMYVNYLA